MRHHPVILTLALLAAILVAPIGFAAEEPTKRPNIVLILADDLGFSDLGSYGGEIPTPNIDSLAASGVRFTQFYNNARCCPTRATLMTGLYPHQAGIGAMIDPYAKWQRDAANSPAYQVQLKKEIPTTPELLRAAGYHTMMVGKWHLGNRKPAWPSSRGFDRAFALIGGAMNYWGSAPGGEPALMELNGQAFVPPAEGFFSTDAFTDRAVEFLTEADGLEKPYFMYLAYNAPHWPLHARPDEIAKHKGKYLAGWQRTREQRYERMHKLGVLDERVQLTPMDRGQVKPWNQLTDAECEEWDLRMAVYAAMVETMDEGIGKVLQAIRARDDAENTLILFVSDNGGAAEDPNRPGDAPTGTRESFRGYARPWATVSNTPFFRHKVTMYEGGISTPMIAHWPKGIPKDRHGQFVREPAHVIDLLPTFLELAQARPDARFRPEGQSIVRMFKGDAADAQRTFAWEHEGNRAFRKGNWKIVRLGDSSEWELFDLDADRAEQHNLAAEKPELVSELSAAYEQWAKRCGVVPWEQLAPHRPAPDGRK